MRSLTFTWGGAAREFVPTMAVLSAMASELARVSEGAENTLSLAHKMNAGGADPVFASAMLWHMLRASGAGIAREEAYAQLMGAEIPMLEKLEFRQAFLQAVLPMVDMGKKPEAPAAPRPAATKARRKK